MNQSSQENSESGKSDISVDVNEQFGEILLDEREIKKLVRFVAEKFSVSKLVVSLAIVDNDRIKQLNREFLGRDKVTDVISWDLSDEGLAGSKVFDMVVNAQKAKEQADTRTHSHRSELALYIVHGMLHNLGFNDIEPRESSLMHSIEDQILKQTGYGVVYGS